MLLSGGWDRMVRWKVTSGNRFPKVQAEPRRGPHSILLWPLSLIPSPTPTLPSCSPALPYSCLLGIVLLLPGLLNPVCFGSHLVLLLLAGGIPDPRLIDYICLPRLVCRFHVQEVLAFLTVPLRTAVLWGNHRCVHSPGVYCRRNTSTLAKHSGSKQKYTLMYVHGVVQETHGYSWLLFCLKGNLFHCGWWERMCICTALCVN